MSKFNTVTPTTKTTNLAGGEAFKQSLELEYASLLLTSFVKDKFYETASDTLTRLKKLVPLVNPLFAAQAAIYARTVFGMRSITHVVASELAKLIGGCCWAKDFYDRIIYRPDDMLEILAYHTKYNGKMSNAMKAGFASAIGRFDAYQLAKYRGEGKGYKLIDVVNLVHPIPNESNKEALASLVKGELKSFDTWEVELSKAGQTGASKADVWKNLIIEKKIGYFALLRNLRNIIAQAPSIVPAACEMLVNEKLIKKSLVLPFRFTTAFEEMKKLEGSKEVRSVIVALSKAVDISLSNVPVFDGDTLVVLDVSGSMSGKPAQIGSLFSSILLKSNNADFITFRDKATYRNVNIADSTMSIADAMRFASGGTNFHSIFETANKKYHRIIILSDMQGWIGHYSPVSTFNKYKARTGANPFIYSFDLNGYGTMQFPEKNVFAIAGFSDKIFDVMSLVEKDKNALINEIKKISLNV